MKGIEIIEERGCSKEDKEQIEKIGNSYIAKVSSISSKEEHERKIEKIISGLKQDLETSIGGNWNVVYGRNIQITIGLTQNSRLVRLKHKHDDIKIFCFETYSSPSISSTTHTQNETKKAV